MGLLEYRRKRDFTKTREPERGRILKKFPIFVVQEHHASHHHYDFRLEAFGTLKSWAVPKGPSQIVGEKRLAVEVEDHPIAYAKFSGRIPAGQYGAGIVKIWDNGYWIPPNQIKNSLAKGRLEFELKGKKLQGKWLLIRTGRPPHKKKQWLLIRRKDESSTNTPKVYQTPKKSHADPWPKEIKPQLSTLTKRIPAGEDWIHEIKLDGYRTLAYIKKNVITLKTRSGLDWTDHYPAIAKDLSKLSTVNAIIDGEIVVLDENGHSSFAALQSALKSKNLRNLVFCVFDILYLDQKDLREESLESRKQTLKNILKHKKSLRIVFSEHFRGQGKELYQQACDLGLEGIVSKDRNRSYQSGRNSDWLKIKCSNRQEMVIGGYTEPQGERTGFGALLMGVYEKNKLRYIGRVGTGFDESMLLTFPAIFKRLSIKNSPFSIASPNDQGIHWIKPKLVGEVEFKTWTDDNFLRQASFQGFREDKIAKDVRIEFPQILPKQNVALKNGNLHLTHPNRIIYNKDKISKLDVANYYRSIAPWILKYISDRPLSFVRCPDGTSANCFYQKHLSFSPLGDTQEKMVQEQKVSSVNSQAGLLQLIQWGVLEIHTWQGRISRPEYPDQIVFDLDPDGKVHWQNVIKAAERLRKLLLRLGLESFVKTTGGKGLHIHVPITPRYEWDDVKNFSKIVSRQLENNFPNDYTTQMSKKKRVGKIFLDYLRNGAGATAIAPYSLRAKTHAFVAVPIAWTELKSLKSATAFDLQKTLNRLAAQKRDPWANYFKLNQKIRILELASRKRSPLATTPSWKS